MNKKQIAMRILQLRQNHHLTQKEVADYLGIHQPAYSEWESGTTAVKAVDLDKLATLYKMSLDEFLHADQPILNMNDQASNGFNVVHTLTNNGVSAEQFTRLCEIMERNTNVLQGIAAQNLKAIELLVKAIVTGK